MINQGDALNNSMFELGGTNQYGQLDSDENEYLNQSESFPDKLKTTIKVESKSFLHRLFFGKLKSFIVDGSKHTPRSQDEEMFGPMILNPKSNDFYTAWSQFFITPIDDVLTSVY